MACLAPGPPNATTAKRDAVSRSALLAGPKLSQLQFRPKQWAPEARNPTISDSSGAVFSASLPPMLHGSQVLGPGGPASEMAARLRAARCTKQRMPHGSSPDPLCSRRCRRPRREAAAPLNTPLSVANSCVGEAHVPSPSRLRSLNPPPPLGSPPKQRGKGGGLRVGEDVAPPTVDFGHGLQNAQPAAPNARARRGQKTALAAVACAAHSSGTSRARVGHTPNGPWLRYCLKTTASGGPNLGTPQNTRATAVDSAARSPSLQEGGTLGGKLRPPFLPQALHVFDGQTWSRACPARLSDTPACPAQGWDLW